MLKGILMEQFYKLQNNKIQLDIIVQPRASKNKIIGIYQNRLKISLIAPPIEDKANKSCIEFLSKICNINKSRISIVSGNKSKYKTIELMGEPFKILDTITKQL